MAVNYFCAYNMLPWHLRAAAFQPILHPFRSEPVHFAGSKAGIDTGPSHSPSPFQSVDHSAGLRAAGCIGKQPVFPAHHEKLNAALSTVIAQLQMTIFQIPDQVGRCSNR